jgi:5-methylcytosine-specific restriction protein A
MPYLPKKACNKVGCPNLVERGKAYCKIHKRKDTRKSSNARGYNYKWQVESKKFLRKHPTCAKCGEKATVVDHIVPHRGNQGLFWARNNWCPLCERHHNQKTGRGY